MLQSHRNRADRVLLFLCPAAAFGLLVFSSHGAQPFQPSVEGKKLIGSGIMYRSSGFVRDNIEKLEQLPFDGMIIGRFWPFWKGRKGEARHDDPLCEEMVRDPEEPLEAYVAAVKATKFKKFTDNFIGVESSHEGNFDWFDEARCSEMATNWGRLAAAAKAAGLQGLQFDAEVYHAEQLFVYGRDMKRSRRAYEARIEEVGSRVMREVNKHYPDMVLLLYLGHTADWQTMAAPFLDGMLSEAKPGFVMVDGYESAYGFRDAAQFEAGRTRITRHAVAQSHYRPQYRQHVQAGFAVWPCNWHGKPPTRRPFDPANFSTNHYTPDELAYTIQCALSHSDKYVWVWSESLNFWKGTVRVDDREGNLTVQPIPKEYVEALERGKRGNLPQPPPRDYSKADTTPK